MKLLCKHSPLLFVATLVVGGGLFACRAATPTPAIPATPGAPALSAANLLPTGNPHRTVLRFERISASDGLSFPKVTDVMQDHLGFMWFATSNGLNKYDGYTFTVYRHNPSEPTSIGFDDLNFVFEDSHGVIWVGGGQGVDRFDREKGYFTHGFERGPANCILEDSQGTVWIGFWDGLYGYNATGKSVTSYFGRVINANDPTTISNGAVQAVLEDASGALWVGTSSGLDRRDPQTGLFEHYRHTSENSNSLSSNNVQALFEDSAGNLWVGTEGGGLDRFERATGRFIHYKKSASDPGSLGSSVVLDVLEDRNGNLWVGTVNGLEQYLPEQDRFLHHRHSPNNPESLSDNLVYSLFEDSAGVLWIATANGLSKYIPSMNQFGYLRDGFEAYKVLGDTQQLVSLSESRVMAIHEDRQGILWFGTFLDGLYRFDPGSGEIQAYRQDPEDATSIISNQVLSIYQDSVGVLWIGTANGWLEQLDPQTGVFLHSYRRDAEITSITEDFSGNLWVGTRGQGVSHLEFDEKFLYQHRYTGSNLWRFSGNLSSSIVETVFVDHQGVPWVGTYNGGVNLWDSKNKRFLTYLHDPADLNSLSHDHVLALYQNHQAAQPVMWIGTMGGGLNRFDYNSQTFSHYTVADGLADDIVQCILADDDGFLWLSTPKGLSRFDPRAETFRNYDASDGVSGGMSHPGVCLKSQSGLMYFGTPNGVIVFDPAAIHENLHIPPIVLSNFEINEQPVLQDAIQGQRFELAYWQNYLAFEFAALDYTAPGQNQYAYRMDGIDSDWVYAGTRRRADYPNMQAGEYVFHVKGANQDGIWNEQGITLDIKIAPPFWTTGWFLSLAALTIAGLIYSAYRLRVRSLEIQRQELEQQVNERTHEIEQQRQQIEALYLAGEDLYQHLDLAQVLQVLVDKAVQLLKAEKGALFCWDEAHENLIIQVAHGFQPETVANTIIPKGQGVAGWVAIHGEPVIVENVVEEPRVTRPIVETEGIRAFMQVPIQIGEDIFGVFSADYLQPRTFDESEKHLLLSLAQQAALAIRNAQLYGQAQELAATRERNRLARELHDAVTQTLFSASLIAEALPAIWERDSEKGRERLTKLRLMSRGALAEMRALLLELRPAALVETSLDDLLHQLGEAVTGREGVPVKVDIRGECKLPPDVHIALYRIAQEALNNVVKHARSTQVNIDLEIQRDENRLPSSIKLRISDDGRGFDLAKVSPERFGLNIMRERAHAIGATLQIQSQPGHGTQVTVQWNADQRA